MCPRGEVGAGVIAISLGLGMQGAALTALDFIEACVRACCGRSRFEPGSEPGAATRQIFSYLF